MRVDKDDHKTSENNLRQSVEYLSVLVRVAVTVALAAVGVRRHVHGVPRSRLTVRLGRLKIIILDHLYCTSVMYVYCVFQKYH